ALPGSRGGELSVRGRAVHAHQRVQASDGARGARHDDHLRISLGGRRPILSDSAARESGAIQALRGTRGRHRRRDFRRPARDLAILQYGPDRRSGSGNVSPYRRQAQKGAAATDSGRRGMSGAAPPLELWGGVECTVVRIGDEFRSQLHETGHWSRMSDIDAMADLGIKAVRYPIVWETVAPEVPTELDFSWHDQRLNRLRE